MIAKADLRQGEYYLGRCKRLCATLGRWDAQNDKFVVMEFSLGFWTPTWIDHAEDDTGKYEIFEPVLKTNTPEQEIPLEL